MSSVRTAVLGIFTVISIFWCHSGQADSEIPVFVKYEDCVDALKAKRRDRKSIMECSDSAKDPTWQGAPAYMCTFDSVEGELWGLNPETEYHEARHVATTWLCERLASPGSGRRWALYKSIEAEWTYAVTDGTRMYAGRPKKVRALWEKSNTQTFYVLCPSTMQVMKEHYNGKSGGSVGWTSAAPGATEHEPYLYFPRKHTSVSYDYFSPADENQTKNTGARPCRYANPYAGQDGKSSQNPNHNREAPEHPSADDGIFNEPVWWKEPPRK